MRILQITNRIPYPPKDGGAICTYNLTKSYSENGCEVTLLAMNTSKHYINLNKIPQDFHNCAKLIAVNVDNRVKILDALINLFKKKSYHIQRFESKTYILHLIFLQLENQLKHLLF